MGHRTEYMKQYRQTNKEHINQKKKEWNEKNKDNKKDRTEYMKQYREKNKEKIAQQKKDWIENNQDKIAIYKDKPKKDRTEYMKQYRLNNKDKIKEINKRHYDKIKENRIKIY
jgi:hypothetical protein